MGGGSYLEDMCLTRHITFLPRPNEIVGLKLHNCFLSSQSRFATPAPASHAARHGAAAALDNGMDDGLEILDDWAFIFPVNGHD